MSNTRRVPFVLNLDDPIDVAIWQVLEPMLARRRASAWLRAVAAEKLGLAGATPAALLPMSQSADFAQAKRPIALPSAVPLEHFAADLELNEDDLEDAADNFLNAFG